MFANPVRLALRSVSRVISRNVTTQRLAQRGNGRVLDDVLNRLDHEVKRTGRVATKDLISAYSLVQKTGAPSSTHALMLLRCCGSFLADETPEKRNELVDQIWQTLKSKQELDISHYNALLQVYIENNRAFNPLEFLQEIENAGLEPNRATYQKLIHTYCLKGDIEGATKILEFLKQKDIPVNESVFNSLIMGYGVIGDSDAAIGTLEIMLKSDVVPTSATYTVLLQVLAKKAKSDPKKFISTLDKAEADDIFFLDRQKLEIVKELLLNDADGPLVDRLLNSMQRKVGYNADASLVTLALLNAGKTDEAIKIFNTMAVPSMAAKTKTHGMNFISQMVRSPAVPVERVIAFCKNLKENGLNDYGISKATEVAFEFRDKETCRALLKEFLTTIEDNAIRPHYFWPMLAKCTTEQEVLSIVGEDMAGIAYSGSALQLIETLDYVFPKVHDIDMVLERLKKIGFSYSVLLTALCRFYLSKGDFASALNYLRDQRYASIAVLSTHLDFDIGSALAKHGTPGEAVAILKEILKSAPYNSSIDYVGVCLDGLLSNGGLTREIKGQNVVNLFMKAMKLERIRISPEYANRIKARYPLNDSHNQLLTDITMGTNEVFTGEGIEVDRALSRSVDELENELIELKSKGLNTRGALRSLLLSYCRSHREALVHDEEEGDSNTQIVAEAQKAASKRVFEIIKDIEETGMQLTDSLRAVLMEFYALQGQFDKAFAIKDQVPSSFPIDDFKIFNFAQCLIKAGHVDRALKLLEEEKISPGRLEKNRNLDRDERSGLKKRHPLDRSIFRLLNAAANYTKDPQIVNKVFELTSAFRDETPNNVMLGPLIKVHLLRNDIESALSQFTQCVSSYKLTPWCGELMKQLIEKEDTANLQLVTDLMISCHGESNTLYDLAFAFVRTNKINQARKALSSGTLYANRPKVALCFERLIKDKDINGVRNWVNVTKEIRDVDKDELYFYLIRGYKDLNDPKGALDVWAEMQSEGVVPSDRTLAYLGRFLSDHKITPPFTVPEVSVDASRAFVSDKSPLETDFNKAIRAGDVEKAYEIRKERLKSGKPPTLTQENAMIDKLLDRGLVSEAFEIVHQLSQEGLYPVPRLLRNLSTALAKKGMVEEMEKLLSVLPAEFTKQTFFTECVAEAYITAGKEKELIEKLESINPFPLSSIMTLLIKKPELEDRLAKMAATMAQRDQYYLPQNMIWLFRMKNGRYEEAESIMKNTPALKNNLLFSSLLRFIRDNQNIEAADRLIETLNKSNLSPRSVGIAISAKIDTLVDMDRPEDAEKLLLEMISNPSSRVHSETGATIPPTQLSDVNRMSLIRLYSKLAEKTGRDPAFSLPDKPSRNDTSDSSDSDTEKSAVNTAAPVV